MFPPPSFQRYLALARRYLAAERLPVLLRKVAQKAKRQADRLGRLAEDVQLLWRLLAAWWRGEYPAPSRQALLAVVAALLYFLAPLDALPDWLVAVGLLDDLAVLRWVMQRWSGELDAFRVWLQGRSADQLARLEHLPDERSSTQ